MRRRDRDEEELFGHNYKTAKKPNFILSSPAIGNSPRTSVSESGNHNPQQCYKNKHRSSASLYDIIGLFFVAQKGAGKHINIMFT